MTDQDTQAVVGRLSDALAKGELALRQFAGAPGTSPSRFFAYQAGRTIPSAVFLLRGERIADALVRTRSASTPTPVEAIGTAEGRTRRSEFVAVDDMVPQRWASRTLSDTTLEPLRRPRQKRIDVVMLAGAEATSAACGSPYGSASSTSRVEVMPDRKSEGPTAFFRAPLDMVEGSQGKS